MVKCILLFEQDDDTYSSITKTVVDSESIGAKIDIPEYCNAHFGAKSIPK